MNCCNSREYLPEDVYLAIASVAAYAAREGFNLGTLYLAPAAVELMRNHEKLIKLDDRRFVITFYGHIEIISQDS